MNGNWRIKENLHISVLSVKTRLRKLSFAFWRTFIRSRLCENNKIQHFWQWQLPRWNTVTTTRETWLFTENTATDILYRDFGSFIGCFSQFFFQIFQCDGCCCCWFLVVYYCGAWLGSFQCVGGVVFVVIIVGVVFAVIIVVLGAHIAYATYTYRTNASFIIPFRQAWVNYYYDA